MHRHRKLRRPTLTTSRMYRHVELHQKYRQRKQPWSEPAPKSPPQRASSHSRPQQDDQSDAMTEGKSTQLVDFVTHRFLGMGSSIRRMLEKWEALVAWYRARTDQAARQRTAPISFPLAQDYDTLAQIISLIQPLERLNRMSQAESDNQVEVLLALYHLRLNTLKAGSPLKDFRSTTNEPVWIEVEKLTPIVVETRDLLRSTLNDRFLY